MAAIRLFGCYQRTDHTVLGTERAPATRALPRCAAVAMIFNHDLITEQINPHQLTQMRFEMIFMQQRQAQHLVEITVVDKP